MIAAVDNLLLEAEHDRPEVFVVGEVVPVLGAVEVALVRLLLDRRQLEGARPVELLLDGRLAARLKFVNLRQARRAHLIRNTPQDNKERENGRHHPF